MNDFSPTNATSARTRPLRRIVFPGSVALFLLGCQEQQAPTTEEIRKAYAAHVGGDPAHAAGLAAKAPPVVIPNQEPKCTPDGNGHFDCRIRVIFEAKDSKRSQRSQEHNLHIRRDAGTWIIDSLN